MKFSQWPIAFLAFALAPSIAFSQAPLADFRVVDEWQERIRWRQEENGVRALIVAPNVLARSERCLVIYATPNGNTLEQTLGCRPGSELDWRYGIQHVAAQIRWCRQVDDSKDYVLAVVQSPELSWPGFRQTTKDANRWIDGLIEALKIDVAATEVTLACHSGGGSMLWGWMNHHSQLPNHVTRLIFLDANYSYSEQDGHGKKIVEWLQGQSDHRLIVIAYDDREIVLNGKKIIDDQGGTFRASQRMRAGIASSIELVESSHGRFRSWTGLDGRVQFHVHVNPDNKILHTALVGEMNGLAFALLERQSKSAPAVGLGDPPVYGAYIQEQPFVDPRISSAKLADVVAGSSLLLPPRSAESESGSAFCRRIATLDRTLREVEIRNAILSGNVPHRARVMVSVQVTLGNHTANYSVTGDSISIGSDDDFVRMPVTPSTAIAICDATQTEMITTKISDDLFSAATARLTPRPLSTDRDQVSAFVTHHNIIQEQLNGIEATQLIVGIKKDLVLSNRLREKPHRVAIYGWHHLDGRPIQPLYVGHVDWYVDYSHGLRLINDKMTIDGQAWSVREVLNHSELHKLLSREGRIDSIELRRQAHW